VLREIDAGEVPVLLAWNKADLVDPEVLDDCLRTHPARSPFRPRPARACPSCLQQIGDRLRETARILECFVPYDRADVLAALHRAGEVLVEVARRARHPSAGPAPGARDRPFRRVHTHMTAGPTA